ncbi:YitT family protein [Thiospirochaeta perfilievii]|uniref:YitT family protein n=1 Tax=Thiospirochaeta perfilievii TaxID=252967 RepID=A0A5C1QEB7_9SPIO|nr:YitT family protein [Thiospirochaeta perfilievii]QEN05931.1 YitT family protein [Thiospirochaeta perfilievii]
MLKKHIIKELRDWKLYIGISLGCIISAVAIGIFLAPNSVASGGVTGASMVINSFLPMLPVGKLSILLNIPIFILCLIVLGPSFGVKSLYATFFLGFSIDYFSLVTTPTHDIFLASVFGGVILGLGLGMVIRFNATTGGTDLLAKIGHKLIPSFSIGQILLVIDVIVLISAAIVFDSVEIGLYAAISLFITTNVIDAVILGIDFSRAAYIVSSKSDQIAQEILTTLDRGVTGLSGKGMYSGDDKMVLLCVLRKRDIPKLRQLVKRIDNNAFVFLSEVRDVIGEGFNPHE